MYTRLHRKDLPKFLFIIFLFFVACGSDENVEPNKPDPDWTSCTLMRVDGADAAAGIAILFEYNSESLPVKRTETSTSNGNSIVSTIEYDAKNNIVKISQPLAYIEYGYDADNKVISGSIFGRQNQVDEFSKRWSIIYTYNEKGQMDSTIIENYSYERYEYDDKGYLLNVYYKQGSGEEKLSRQILDYDDQKVPGFVSFSYLILGFDVNIITLKLPQPGLYNAKSVKVTLNNGSTEMRDYAYTYNKLGYPLTATETGGLLGTTTFRSTYDCK